jgi:hypothetical protein
MDSTPEADFPSSESFVDCAGARRHFELEVRHLPNHGYAAEAREVTSSEHGGYVFKAFAEASGTMALARLLRGILLAPTTLETLDGYPAYRSARSG